MIKDTNPEHYKVDGANFIEYMNDPKISGFGNWMFANGFNSGVWASTNWVSVNDRMPDEDGSTLICTKNGRVCTARFYKHQGGWNAYAGKNAAYWMPLPTPPEEVSDGNVH